MPQPKPEKLSFPRRLTLEVTNACNLRCLMCARSFSKFKTAHMSREIFERCRQFFPFVQEVALFGWGEPTIHPDFGRMLEAVWEAGKETYFTTNGLNLDKYAKMIVGGNQPFLNISLDGATPATYNRIRVGSDFKKVITNIRAIGWYKNLTGSDTPRLRFTFVAMKDNIDELPLLADLAADLGVEAIKVVYLNAYSPIMEKQVMWYYPELVKENLVLLEAKAKMYGLKLYLPPKIDPKKKERISQHRACDVPWKEMFVDSRGKVRLCVISTEVLGDVRHDDLGELWNGQRYAQIRTWVNSASPLGECARCHQCYRVNVNAKEAHLAYGAGIVKNAGVAQE